jgi:hypothetical protein
MKRLAAFFLVWLAWQGTAPAHVIDQYLQSALITVAPDGVRVELRMIPGVLVADRVFSLIDSDGNGQLSPSERDAYARRVLQDLLLKLDGEPAKLALLEAQFPSRSEMQSGVGRIRLQLLAQARLAGGEHRLAFRNDHLPELARYMANASVPASDAIRIDGQQRDFLQRELELDVHVKSLDLRRWLPWLAAWLFSLVLVLALSRRTRSRPFADAAAIR